MQVTTVACLAPCMQAKQNHQKLYTQGFRVSDELQRTPEKTIIESESWSVSAIRALVHGQYSLTRSASEVRMPSSHMKQDHGSLLRLGQHRFLPEFMAVCR